MIEDFANDSIWEEGEDNFTERPCFGRIERITVDYLHRFVLCKGDYNENIWNWHSEHLMLDRTEGMLEYVQNYDNGKYFFHRFYDIAAIRHFLDSLDPQAMFSQTEGNPPDSVNSDIDKKTYTIIINFSDKEPVILKGTFDKKGLPSDYSEFIEKMYVLLAEFGLGDIFDDRIYARAKRRKNEYIFCSVIFNEYGKAYYYITDDESLEVEDIVLVPVGKESALKPAEIVKIDYFDKENAPYPINKVKKIIRKCTFDDLKSFVDMNDDVFFYKDPTSEK